MGRAIRLKSAVKISPAIPTAEINLIYFKGGSPCGRLIDRHSVFAIFSGDSPAFGDNQLVVIFPV